MEKLTIKKKLGCPALPENAGGGGGIFQQRETLRDLFLTSLVQGLHTKTIPLSFNLYSDGRLVLTLPLMYSRKFCCFYGSSGATAMARLAPIFSDDLPFEKKSFCLNYLLENVDSLRYSFTRVPEATPESAMFEELDSSFNCQKCLEDCVRINYSSYDSFNAYFSSLSKSVRQNIRTAHNRLKTDDIYHKTILYDGENIPRRVIRKLKKIYIARLCTRYPMTMKIGSRIYYRFFDYVFRSAKKRKETKIGVLYIQNDIAAFFIGHYDRNSETLFIPRLAINDTFARYSPGYLLVTETISKSFAGDLDYCFGIFDLIAGTEKYKLDLGGEIYHRASYNISRSAL